MYRIHIDIEVRILKGFDPFVLEVYSKISIIRPGRSRLLEFEKI